MTEKSMRAAIANVLEPFGGRGKTIEEIARELGREVGSVTVILKAMGKDHYVLGTRTEEGPILYHLAVAGIKYRVVQRGRASTEVTGPLILGELIEGEEIVREVKGVYEVPEGKYPCDECERTFKNEDGFRIHKAWHEKQRKGVPWFTRKKKAAKSKFAAEDPNEVHVLKPAPINMADALENVRRAIEAAAKDMGAEVIVATTHMERDSGVTKFALTIVIKQTAE